MDWILKTDNWTCGILGSLQFWRKRRVDDLATQRFMQSDWYHYEKWSWNFQRQESVSSCISSQKCSCCVNLTYCRVHTMEPQAPGKVPPAFSSSPKLELVGVLCTSGPDIWKFGVLVSYTSVYFILSAWASPLFTGHVYKWPAPNMEFEGSPHGRLWRCSLVSWGQSSNV